MYAWVTIPQLIGTSFFSTSHIFYTLFVAFLGIVTLGIGHGLILLPYVCTTFVEIALYFQT